MTSWGPYSGRTAKDFAEQVSWMPVFIEYHREETSDGEKIVPFNVLLANGSSYDLDWCEPHGCCYWSKAGSGSPTRTYLLGGRASAAEWTTDEERCPIWAADWLQLVDRDGKPADLAKLGYRRLAEPLGDPFDEAIESTTVNCERCDSRMPDGLDGEDPCAHLWWCDTEHGWVGPGSAEETKPCSDECCGGCSGRIDEEEET